MNAIVIGAGSIGARHAKNLRDLGVEVSLEDIDAERARAVASELGLAGRTPTAVDLIVIGTPSSNHMKDLRQAVERAPTVFVEKPLGTSLQDVVAAQEVMKSLPNAQIMVGCNMRFSLGYQRFKQQIATSGRLLSLNIDFGWYLPVWRPNRDYKEVYSAHRLQGGGIVLDAIHEIDYALNLAGPVQSIQGWCQNTRSIDIDAEDLADITLLHANGCQTHLHLDYLKQRYTKSTTAICEHATITWDYASARVTSTSIHSSSVVAADPEDLDRNTMYIAEMRHLISSMQGQAPWINGLGEAAETLRVALIARDGPAKRLGVGQ